MLLGNLGLYIITAGVILSAFTALNANIYTVSRLLYALGRDGRAPRHLALTWRGKVVEAKLFVGLFCMIILHGSPEGLRF